MTEITVNLAGQAIDATRYYSSPGAPTTVRRTGGKTTGHSLSVLLADHHNTATTSVDMAGDQQVTRRKSDPYGNPRGAQPGNWPGSRTFVGTGVDDTSTALTHIGAREYESTTGRFISVDPIIDITDPMQMNGYTYANGNPVTETDPSGLCSGRDPHGSGCSAAIPGKEYVTPDNPATDPARSSGGSGNSKGNSGSNKHGGGGCSFFSKCNWNKQVNNAKQFWNENKVMIVSVTTEIVVGTACIAAAGATGVATGGVGFALAAGCGAIAGAAGAAVANAMNPNADHSTLGVLKDMGSGALWGAAGGAAGAAAAPVIAAIGKAVGKGVGQFLSKLASKGGGCPAPNSFASGTMVLMADGTTKPIEKLEPGDKVLATDPETGETVTKDVTATILGEGEKNLVEVTIANRDAGVPSEVITATDKHPFWVTDLAEWVDATDLKPGQWLRTSAGTLVQVSAVKRYTAHAKVHNLTIADLHTYYVLAGATPVLVHNCGGSNTLHSATCTCASGGQPRLANGTMGRNPNPPASRLGRDQYPSGYRASTHQAMRAKYTDRHGNWLDDMGNIIQGNVTYDHIIPVVDH